MSDFKKQLIEDLKHIQKDYKNIDPQLENESYAFNLWILTVIYSMDEEVAVSHITEYNDKGIDCFVHYPESKEIYLIQNKYYDDQVAISRKEYSDFLTSPLAILNTGDYKKSPELQNIFNIAKNDDEYKIVLEFNVTNNKKNKDLDKLKENFNNESHPYKCQIITRLCFLDDIENTYYGKKYDNKIDFDYILESKNSGTCLQIKPHDYGLPEMNEAYYLMTPISNFYDMNLLAEKKTYQLFEENIREYMGKTSINNKIISTLRDSLERKNFFYYNNGITVICNSAKRESSNPYKLRLLNPQIVNGCQTVNTICEVLSNKSSAEIEKEYQDVYVMTKILVEEKSIDKHHEDFYKKVVKYTNSQNAISEKAFASKNEYFLSIQKQFEKRGFILLVKPSDKSKYIRYYKDKKVDKNKMLNQAKNHIPENMYKIKTLNDIMIPLDKMLQVVLAYREDGFYAFTKKNLVLRKGSKIYENISTELGSIVTIDNLVRLYYLYKKAENDKKQSDDKKTPIPYYLIGFLSHFIEIKTFDRFNNAIEQFSKLNQQDQNIIYSYLKSLTTLYRTESKLEYNVMVKKEIDKYLLNKQIKMLNTIDTFKKAVEFFAKL